MEKNLFSRCIKYLLLFLSAEIAGIIFCNAAGYRRIQNWNFYENLVEKADYGKVFSDVFTRRIKYFAVTAILETSVFCRYIPAAALTVSGFSYGIIACITTVLQGTGYFVIILFAITGHMLLYGYGIYLLTRRDKGMLRYGTAFVIILGGMTFESFSYSKILCEISVR